jgi:iron only hydrogenase large subunit-like protein
MTARNRNDMPEFLAALERGESITVLAAPAAWAVLPDMPRIPGLFRALGVRAFFPVLPYADITAWVYYRLLTENPASSIITSACAGMNRYIAGNYPALAPSPSVYSPLLCAARYLKTYCGLGGAFAFLSPCLQKHLEFSVAGEELLRYNLTIAAVSDWVDTQKIDTREIPPEGEPDGVKKTGDGAPDLDFSRGLTVAAFGTITGALGCLIPDLDHVIAEGAAEAGAYLAGGLNPRGRPLVFEPYFCAGGCINGQGIHRSAKNGPKPESVQKRARSPQDAAGAKAAIIDLFARFDAALDMKDFCYER